MYKYTLVLCFLAYYHGVFCWDTNRMPNSLSDSYPNYESNPIYEDSSDSDNWAYGNNQKTHFNDETPRNDFNSRITFPGDDQDYSRNNVFKDKNTQTQRFILKCIRSCPLKNEFRPVCGSDDITYYNIELLRCVRGCGDDVELKHLSSCNDFAETSTQPPTTTRANLDLCLSVCPTTTEYNPVCGTDDVTYKNIGKLSCAQICGVDVEVKRRSPCPKKTSEEDLPSTDGTIETTTINSRYFQSCMDSCLTTTEYKPVCASNGNTYYNSGKFQCARNCGLNISIQALGVCQINQSEDSVTLAGTTESTTTRSYEVSNKESVVNLKNLLDKIFSKEDTTDPQLDVRHS